MKFSRSNSLEMEMEKEVFLSVGATERIFSVLETHCNIDSGTEKERKDKKKVLDRLLRTFKNDWSLLDWLVANTTSIQSKEDLSGLCWLKRNKFSDSKISLFGEHFLLHVVPVLTDRELDMEFWLATTKFPSGFQWQNTTNVKNVLVLSSRYKTRQEELLYWVKGGIFDNAYLSSRPEKTNLWEKWMAVAKSTGTYPAALASAAGINPAEFIKMWNSGDVNENALKVLADSSTPG